MSEPRSIPAVYDPGRGQKGRFAPGNKISTGWNNAIARKFQELQAAWLDCCTLEQQHAVNAELFWLTQQRENLEVKVKALVYWTDRTNGKPIERIDLTTTSDRPAPVIELSPEEITVLEKVVARTGDPGDAG